MDDYMKLDHSSSSTFLKRIIKTDEDGDMLVEFGNEERLWIDSGYKEEVKEIKKKKYGCSLHKEVEVFDIKEEG